MTVTVDRYLFRVLTEDNTIFMFQVYDQIALERWISWFMGPVDGDTPSNKNGQSSITNNTTYETTQTPSAYYQQQQQQQQQQLQFRHSNNNQVVNPLATFGAVQRTTTYEYSEAPTNSAITTEDLSSSVTPTATMRNSVSTIMTENNSNYTNTLQHPRRPSSHYYPEDDSLSAIYYQHGPFGQSADIVNDSSDMLLRDQQRPQPAGDISDMWRPSNDYFPLSPNSRLSFDIAMNTQQRGIRRQSRPQEQSQRQNLFF